MVRYRLDGSSTFAVLNSENSEEEDENDSGHSQQLVVHFTNTAEDPDGLLPFDVPVPHFQSNSNPISNTISNPTSQSDPLKQTDYEPDHSFVYSGITPHQSSNKNLIFAISIAVLAVILSVFVASSSPILSFASSSSSSSTTTSTPTSTPTTTPTSQPYNNNLASTILQNFDEHIISQSHARNIISETVNLWEFDLAATSSSSPTRKSMIIVGPKGSGKTSTALQIAHGLASPKRVLILNRQDYKDSKNTKSMLDNIFSSTTVPSVIVFDDVHKLESAPCAFNYIYKTNTNTNPIPITIFVGDVASDLLLKNTSLQGRISEFFEFDASDSESFTFPVVPLMPLAPATIEEILERKIANIGISYQRKFWDELIVDSGVYRMLVRPSEGEGGSGVGVGGVTYLVNNNLVNNNNNNNEVLFAKQGGWSVEIILRSFKALLQKAVAGMGEGEGVGFNMKVSMSEFGVNELVFRRVKSLV